jgi:type VI secretion system secreted protein Hcp
MAADTHIKFDGVEGEATHADHKGEIAVETWSHGVHNASKGAGGGHGRGKADPMDFTFVHSYDKSSPTLMKKCASGVHFKEVVLTSRKSGEGQKDFLKITMKEVFITSIVPSSDQSGEIMEAVAMSYASIDYGYKPQDEKGGLGGEVKFGWNLKTTTIT